MEKLFDNTEPPLRRGLTLPLLVFYGLGTILGAGIYVLIGEVAAEAGSHAPVSFLIAAALAGVSAFSFAELSARFPKSAGEALYVEEAFGRRRLSTLVGLMVVLVAVVSSATIARGFTGYLRVFVDVESSRAIVALVLLLALVAGWGITESVTLASVFTVMEIFGLVLVIWAGRHCLGDFPARFLEINAPPSAEWPGVLAGAFLAFYAFIGFEDMVNVAEEVQRPRRNLPLAIILVVGVSTFLYFGVALVSVLALPERELANSAAPLALLYEKTTGRSPAIISLISIFAVTNGALIQIILASRVLYGLADLGWIPARFGTVNRRTRTPLFSTFAVAAVVLVLALWLPIATLARITSFFTLLVFVSVNLSLWRMKGKDPGPEGVPHYPRWLPLAGAVASASFIAVELIRALRSTP